MIIMHKFISSFLLVSLFCVFTLSAQSEKTQTLVDNAVHSSGYPGIIVGVSSEEGTYAYTSGWADRENAIKMTDQNLLHSGSAGKTFVAAIVMQLILEGKLNMEDPISNWFETYSWFEQLPNAKDLRVIHLLRHQSGIERYEFKEAFTKDLVKDPDKNWKPEELIAYVLGDTASFEPGKSFQYADTNYILIGMIIEAIEGKTYYEVLNDRILRPMGLTDMKPTNTRIIKGFAQGYTGPNDPLGFDSLMLENGKCKYNMQFEWTGGGLAWKTQDYAKWLKDLFEGKAFDLEKCSETYFNSIPSPEIGGSYGIGYQELELPGLGKAFGHSGFFPGYFTLGLYYPEKKISIAMQVNTTDPAMIRNFFPDYMKIAQSILTN